MSVEKRKAVLEFALWTKDFILQSEDLKVYAENLINTLSEDLKKIMTLHEKTIYNIYSHNVPTIEPYARVIYELDQLKDYYFNFNRFQGLIGIRETNKLKDIIDIKVNDFNVEKLVKDELNNYFGKVKKRDYLYSKDSLEYYSSYKLQNDFSIDLVRLKDGLKTVLPSHRNIYQLNKCSVGEININEFARSLDSKVLPFHRCTINFNTMQKSINSLNSELFCALSVFYFPERVCKYKREFKKLQDLKESNYKKVWELKEKSLVALIDCIMNIQYLESEIA